MKCKHHSPRAWRSRPKPAKCHSRSAALPRRSVRNRRHRPARTARRRHSSRPAPRAGGSRRCSSGMRISPHPSMSRSRGASATWRLTRFPDHPEHPGLVNSGAANETRAGDLYHSDVSWREIPSMGSILRCVQCPEVGGDTIRINMVAAYDTLPDDAKARIASLNAIYDFLPLFGIAVPADQHEAMRTKFPPVNPRSCACIPKPARDSLCQRGVHDPLSNFAKGRADIASASTTSWPKWTCCSICSARRRRPSTRRLRWRPEHDASGISSCQHYALQDYLAPRHMMRATVSVMASSSRTLRRQSKRNENDSNTFSINGHWVKPCCRAARNCDLDRPGHRDADGRFRWAPRTTRPRRRGGLRGFPAWSESSREQRIALLKRSSSYRARLDDLPKRARRNRRAHRAVQRSSGSRSDSRSFRRQWKRCVTSSSRRIMARATCVTRQSASRH